ncbi:putative IMV heparin binding surface protein [Yalta virus]|nr:putative IMV heparin binding surface protein [Yalta virus]
MLSFKPIIITLKNRPDRIEKIKSFYQPYINEIEFFYGLPKDELRKYKSKITTKYCNNFCTLPMVGCASSHILTWFEISKMKDGLYMVIEDDTFINLSEVEKKFQDINDLFKKYKNLLLQIVGEGLHSDYEEVFNSLVLDKYKYNFFLGCYMLTPSTANMLYQYFFTKKISYHIDFSLNYIKDLKILILRDKNIGEQKGLTDSNMKESNSNLFYEDNYNRLYYALNFPICTLGSIIITFNVILLFLFIILACFYKNVFIFGIIGVFLLDIIKFDY